MGTKKKPTTKKNREHIRVTDTFICEHIKNTEDSSSSSQHDICATMIQNLNVKSIKMNKRITHIRQNKNKSVSLEVIGRGIGFVAHFRGLIL